MILISPRLLILLLWEVTGFRQKKSKEYSFTRLFESYYFTSEDKIFRVVVELISLLSISD